MKIFYTADHHFGHEKIIDYEERIFLSVEEMDVFMIKRWNEVVGNDDLVYHLGDFCFKHPELLLSKLKGRKILLKGNHDHKTNTALIRCGFDKVEKELLIYDGDKRVLLSHWPQNSWVGMYDNIYHFHGHIHSKNVEPFVANRYNVGVDVCNYYPKTIDEIIS